MIFFPLDFFCIHTNAPLTQNTRLAWEDNYCSSNCGGYSENPDTVCRSLSVTLRLTAVQNSREGGRERPNEDYPEWVYFSFQFNTEMFYEIQEEANRILFSKPPRVPIGGYWTLNIGDLYLIIGPYVTERPDTQTNSPDYTPAVTSVSTSDQILPTPTTPAASSIITSPTTATTPISTETTYFIRISFQTMNLTYTDELNNKSSALYIAINTMFCSDIDRILRDRLDLFPTYMQCQIDVFGGQPPRVNFSLQFQDLRGTDRGTVKENAISMIIANARREDYMGWYVLLIGNLLISMDGITVEFSTVPTTPNIYNAISYNYTFYMYRGNYTEQLRDKNSPRFKEQAYLFCQDVDNIFQMSGLRNVKKRYYGCVVDEFGPNLEVRFRVILRDIDIVRVSTMFSIFAYQSEQVSLEGISYLILGGVYVAFDADPVYRFLILETFTTHPYPYTTTTPSVEYSSITLTLSILSPDYTADLSTVTSARYRLLAGSFCSDISTWLSNWSSVDFFSCDDVKFQQDPYIISAELRFVGTLSETVHYNMYTIIMEEAARVYSGGQLGSQIGEILVSYASLLEAQRKIKGTGSRTTPRSTTESASDSTSPGAVETTTVFEPCLLNPNAKTVLHPSRCDGFYTCANGVAFFVDCTPGWVVQGDTCVLEPAGYVCQK
ncbi:hypothetical protein RRG08_057118 [Elysia crispata]|uniref:Chitin-binding type-2 domain-containing protein n=1 Tax=Elysia crispata TaxID=231223 RepID=A0AAE1AE36_9GAST|nr:hypothetical protein RRG08_057118 [Elysia crispata]